MVAKVSAWPSKFTCHHLLKSNIFSAPTLARSFCLKSYHHRTSLHNVCKVFFGQTSGPPYERQNILFMGHHWIHYSRFLHMDDKDMESTEHCRNNTIGDGADNAQGGAKVKRKKLKGKRAVVKWLKFFRWKKKKEYERMTAEEKILFKLKKARRKEERYVEALRKIEPKETSETTHDPEILTPEEHFFFLKMGRKAKNYVPIGRRGIYQGVILNMHLHWKKHQTLQVVVKTFTPDEVKEIAAELARLSGGIVLEIHEEDTIIMYRGKNYSQPPTEMMSPRVTLHRIKALKKSKYRDGLRAVRKFIPRLEQELDMLRGRFEREAGIKAEVDEDVCEGADADGKGSVTDVTRQLANDKLKEIMGGNDYPEEEDSSLGSGMASDSEALSDTFETDSDTESHSEVELEKGKEKEKEAPLYLNLFDEFHMNSEQEQESFEEDSQQICAGSEEVKSSGKDESELDDADQVFLRAAALLMKKRR